MTRKHCTISKGWAPKQIMQCLVNDITIRDGAVSIGSGSYHIWLEVDDGINDPVQVYLPEP